MISDHRSPRWPCQPPSAVSERANTVATNEARILDQETTAQQQELLAAHRGTLAHLMEQAAQYGGEIFAPPQTANGIAEARSEIQWSGA